LARQVEVRELNLPVTTDQQSEVDNVLQLPGVAVPGVSLQRHPRGLADLRNVQTQALGIDAEEIVGQRADVAGPLAQPRQRQAAFIEMLEESLVELAGGYRLL